MFHAKIMDKKKNLRLQLKFKTLWEEEFSKHILWVAHVQLWWVFIACGRRREKQLLTRYWVAKTCVDEKKWMGDFHANRRANLWQVAGSFNQAEIMNYWQCTLHYFFLLYEAAVPQTNSGKRLYRDLQLIPSKRGELDSNDQPKFNFHYLLFSKSIAMIASELNFHSKSECPLVRWVLLSLE